MKKATKSLIITLFAAMMIFAFGAVSTFAADSYTGPDGAVWTDGFNIVTVDENQYPTKLTLMSDGLVKAELDKSLYPGSTDTATPVYFYDMDGAALNYGVQYPFDLFVGLFWDEENLEYSSIPNAQLILKTDKYSDTTKTVKTQLKGIWSAPIDMPAEFDWAATADQNVTLVAVPESNYDATGTPDSPFMMNQKAIEHKVTVKAPVSTVAYFWDEVADQEPIDFWHNTERTYVHTLTNIPYDGNAHTIINTSATGKDVKWYVLNKSTAQFEEVTKCPEFKAVGDAAKVKSTISWTTKTTTTVTTHTESFIFDVKIVKSSAEPSVGWTKGNGGTSPAGVSYTYGVNAAQAADPAAFLEFANGFTKDTGNVEADIDTIKAFFNDCYDITVTKNAIDSNVQNWTIEPKNLSSEERAQLVKKYKALDDTYVIGTPGHLYALEIADYNRLRNDTTVSVFVSGTPDTKVDDINFVNAPNVTYKAKKIKKKAKSFTVEAKAESGNAIKYTIDSPSKKITIDSATGKVTVAKGLKKGTYKVIVKAKTEAGNGYQACKAERQITIKVKK